MLPLFLAQPVPDRGVAFPGDAVVVHVAGRAVQLVHPLPGPARARVRGRPSPEPPLRPPRRAGTAGV